MKNWRNIIAIRRGFMREVSRREARRPPRVASDGRPEAIRPARGRRVADETLHVAQRQTRALVYGFDAGDLVVLEHRRAVLRHDVAVVADLLQGVHERLVVDQPAEGRRGILDDLAVGVLAEVPRAEVGVYEVRRA